MTAGELLDEYNDNPSAPWQIKLEGVWKVIRQVVEDLSDRGLPDSERPIYIDLEGGQRYVPFADQPVDVDS